MNSPYCNYIQRKITPKSLDVHPTDNALIINCEAEVLISDNNTFKNNSSLFEKTKSFNKIIRLKNFDQDVDLNTICQDVISQSEQLISPSQEHEVIKLLNYLKNRKNLPNKTAIGFDIDNLRPKTANHLIHNSNSFTFNSSLQSSYNAFRLSHSASNQTLNKLLDVVDYEIYFYQIAQDFKEDDLIGKYFDEKVKITQINDYIELLYEDGLEKLKGAVLILRLSLENENLINLTTDETLFCAMSRILREEGRKNYDLCCVILAFFCIISFYKEFHLILTKYKIGASSFELINFIFEKEDILLQPVKLNIETNTKFNIPNENCFLQEDNKNLTFNNHETLINKKKINLLQKKNNRLLQLLFMFLLNLSNDIKTETKIVNKGILILILNCFKRQNLSLELYVTLATFLQRLSVRWETKNKIISYNFIPVFYNIINNIVNQISFYSILSNIILKLIFNLTFDQRCRCLMIKNNFIPKLVQMLIKGRFKNEKLLISIFYQFTLEKQYCNLFMITLSVGKNLINLIVNRTLQIEEKLNKDDFVSEVSSNGDCCFVEYTCLLINLAMEKNCAQIICENGLLDKLFVKAVPHDLNNESFTYVNVCYMKLLRNLSLHEHPYKMKFVEHIDLLVSLIISFDSNKEQSNASTMKIDNFSLIFVTQALDFLSNLNKVDWLQIIKKYSLYSWIRKHIKIGEQFNDEIVLGSLSLLGSCCTQEECALYLVNTDCVKLLIDFLNAKQEDDEIILEILYIINIMANHETVRSQFLVKNSQITAYLLDLLNDKNTDIRSICNSSLDLLAEQNQELFSKLKEERFKMFNKSWLEMINLNNGLNQVRTDTLENENSLNKDLDDDSFTSNENISIFKQKILSFENLKEDNIDLEGLLDQNLKSSSSQNVKPNLLRKQRPQTAYRTRTISAKIAKN